jgi:uncharacterized protein YybS (DUF2232 family)
MIRAAALAAALFLAGGAIPFVGIAVMMFAPAPILGYAIGRPSTRWRTTVSVLIAALLIGLAAGPFEGVGYLLSLGLATAIISELLERQTPFERIVLITTTAIVLTTAAGMVAFAGSPTALVNTVHRTLLDAFSRSESFYQMLGMGTIEEADARGKLLDVMVRLSPAFIAIGAALMVLVNLGLFWRWVGKERLHYVLFSGLAKWRTPEWLIWLLLATGFGLFAPIEPVRNLALDGFILVAAIYFCHGLAIMAFYFQMLAMPLAARGIIYLVAVVQPVLAALVCAMGIFDMWIDFRRLKPPSQEAGSFGDFF